MNNIVSLNNNNTYEFEHLGTQTKLSTDDRYLFHEWEKGAIKGKTSHLLHRLSPNINIETIVDDVALKKIRISWVLIVSAIIIFFSDYNDKIPLLAPFLAGYGLLAIGLNIKHSWPKDCALIKDNYNYKLIMIPQLENESQDEKEKRESFLFFLTNKIEEATRKEFYD
ncbi:MAG: hypothetical protein OQL19_18750 [Gammaproteobacteria bacterium]|nr:hypothetical protein [Gammaproteobacteria bacterium]